jgi:hypothetical protein
MIIKNFGHHWERDAVHWGGQGHGKKGHLKGYLGAMSVPIDFREQIGIYVLYDADLQPVYVGQAGNGNRRLFDRLKDHHYGNRLWNRWRHFSWYGFRGVNKNSHRLSEHDKITKKFKETGGALLNHMEGILIAATEPKLNKQGANWSGATQYFQHVEEDLETPTPQYIATTLETVDEKLDAVIKLIKSKH